MKSKNKHTSMKCSICGRKFVDQEKLGKHIMRHITKELFDYVDSHPDEGKSFAA